MSLLINFFTVILIFVSIFLIFVVLMQKSKSDGGVAAMGGGAMESTFGAESSNVLSKTTINLAIAFFVLSFGLYLAHIYQIKHHMGADSKLPAVTAPAVPAQSAPQPVTLPASEPQKP